MLAAINFSVEFIPNLLPSVRLSKYTPYVPFKFLIYSLISVFISYKSTGAKETAGLDVAETVGLGDVVGVAVTIGLGDSVI